MGITAFMNKIFNAVAKIFNNGRYVKIDGSDYHAGALRSILTRPEVKVAAMVAVANISIEMMNEGTFSIFNKNVLNEITHNILWGGAALTMLNIGRNLDLKSFEDCIDKEGRDLSQRNLSLSETSSLESNLRIGKIGLGVGGVLTVLSTLGENSVGIAAASYVTCYFQTAFMAKKLLDGEYVFCDKPPAKTVSSKTAVASKASLPSPS